MMQSITIVTGIENMKSVIIILAIILAAPALAADSSQPAPQNDNSEKSLSTTEKTVDKKDTQSSAEQLPPGEFASPYFTVKLPEGWQAILPPTEQQGMWNAIFARTSQNPIVAFIISDHGGTDIKTIAEMFAEQFKAPKPPVERHGKYTFSFTQGDNVSHVWIARQEQVYMVTNISGNQKEGLAFIKNNVSSEKYGDLFPQ